MAIPEYKNITTSMQSELLEIKKHPNFRDAFEKPIHRDHYIPRGIPVGETTACPDTSGNEHSLSRFVGELSRMT